MLLSKRSPGSGGSAWRATQIDPIETLHEA